VEGETIMSKAATLKRMTFEQSRLLEFFSEKELQMQIGHPKQAWPVALVKELIDNSLDACETANLSPDIEVIVEKDSISVKDNGPGLPEKTLERSLDYLVRVSDKNFYVSPTRGQLGNALKCVYAAPFVAEGEHGLVEVMTRGKTYRIDVKLNHLVQEPELTLSQEAGFVKNSTLVKMHWPGIAGYLAERHAVDFYNSYPSIRDIVSGFACFNPHLTIRLHGGPGGDLEIKRAKRDWQKFKPDEPTSPHWYTADRLKALIGAYLKTDIENGRRRTIREFVSEFRGLSGTAKQKTVTEAAGLSGAYLADLLDKDQIRLDQVASLLAAMTGESRAIKPIALGVVGEDHIKDHMVRQHGVQPESIKYKKVADVVKGGLPSGVGVCLWDPQRGLEACQCHCRTQLEPDAQKSHHRTLKAVGRESRRPSRSGRSVVHLACPVMPFADRGKTVLALLEDDGGEAEDA
jgi:DNA topoisomerase VI subunit B